MNLELIAVVACVLLAVGWTAWGLRRFSRRQSDAQRAALLAAPLASFDVDAQTLQAYACWQATELERERATMLMRAVKISLWLLPALTLPFAALGLARTTWQSGASVGLAFCGLIIGPLLTVCGGLALALTVRARRLRSSNPPAARMVIGSQGIDLAPGRFQALHGVPNAARMLEGPPLVLDLTSCYASGRTTRYVHARGPVPPEHADAAWAALRELRRRWNLPAS